MVSEWADAESASADFGDERLNRRFALIVSSFGNRPNLGIPAGCRGRAEMAATYRFTDNGRITFDKILAPHAQCTLRRAAEHKVVPFVRDTTEIDLTRPEQQVAGAGGSPKPGSRSAGGTGLATAARRRWRSAPRRCGCARRTVPTANCRR